MTIERVHKIFKGYLDQALNSKFIHKPYAWALFQTWRVVDGIEKVRKDGTAENEVDSDAL